MQVVVRRLRVLIGGGDRLGIVVTAATGAAV
jgi:hypothetical protein